MKIKFEEFIIKLLLIVFWIALIFAYLYTPFLKKKFLPNTINVLTWGDMINLEQVRKFEKETGIKVQLNFYETNDELFAKLQITKGKEYDLITIADNALQFFKDNNVIDKIDKSKLIFFGDIQPQLYKNYFDSNFEYSIPFYWDVYGFGFNSDLFTPNDFSWAAIFDEHKTSGNIAMTDDAFNAVLIAAQYLFSNAKNLNEEQLKQIKELLLKQKKWVKLYTDMRSDYVLKIGSSPLVVAQSAYIYKVLMKNRNLKYVIPKEGGFIIIDLLIIPNSSKKQDLTYRFINFLFQESIMKNHFQKFGYLPTRKSILEQIDTSHICGMENILQNERFSKFSFFDSNVTLDQVNDIWVQVKA